MIDVDHVTVYRWVQRFTPLLIDAARPCRHAVGDRWFVDETYLKVAGVWRYVYRAVDQHGQVIDIYVSKRRNIAAARHFFATALTGHGRPTEVTTDLAAPLSSVVDELIPEAAHDTEQYATDRVGPRPTRGQAETNARSADRSDRVGGDPRSRFRPESSTRPLRTRRRSGPQASTPRGRFR
ncbi:MAG: IS6 family transposase [Planctomycetaceae bacterium]|nr:IS6 family transposase [Planctomycetaceae bacterium]